MTPADDTITRMKDRLLHYIAGYKTGDPDHDANVILKEKHTLRVWGEATAIGRDLNLDAHRQALAEIAALHHDVGRFDQYARFHTFRDADSVDHGELGHEILKTQDFLTALPEADQRIIRRAVRYHNKKEIPNHLAPTERYITQITRDADKLDIFKVMMTRWQNHDKNRDDSVMMLGLEDNAQISPKVYECLMQGTLANYTDMHSQTDFRLLLVSWVYDINFKPTLQRILKRELLDKMRQFLPKTPQIDGILERARQHTAGRLNGNAV